MKTFKLLREVDISGVSGTGVVAEGCQLHNGKCILSWYGDLTSIEVTDSIEDLISIHGHQGSTRVVWENERSGVILKFQPKVNIENSQEDATSTAVPVDFLESGAPLVQAQVYTENKGDSRKIDEVAKVIRQSFSKAEIEAIKNELDRMS